MVIVYLASTLYHAAWNAALKRQLRICDHAAIYLMIAGTYTPFLLALPTPWPTWGLSAIWLAAMAGVIFKLTLGVRYDRLSVALYLVMGWVALLALPALTEKISAHGVAWLLAGGLAYSAGTVFYIRRDAQYSHAIWHLFVALGSALHWVTVMFYLVPVLA